MDTPRTNTPKVEIEPGLTPPKLRLAGQRSKPREYQPAEARRAAARAAVAQAVDATAAAAAKHAAGGPRTERATHREGQWCWGTRSAHVAAAHIADGWRRRRFWWALRI